MRHKVFYSFGFVIIFVCFQNKLNAQKNPDKQDTFFLAKKKGLLGKIGKSISTSTPDIKPVKVENQFLKFKGKIIRNIDFLSLGFNRNINDTTQVTNNFGIALARRFHVKSKERTIKRNLFFKQGDIVYPYLLADNERYLRQLIYLQDARIMLYYAENSTDSVDVVVITKDVFSIGGVLVVDYLNKARLDLKEENFNGSGSQLMMSGFFERDRHPQKAYGTEISLRNIGGRFINWTSGFQNFQPAFNSGRDEETFIYSRVEKPLVTAFIPSTGSFEVDYHKTSDNYISDSLYKSDYQYEYYNVDGWFGYSLDSRSMLFAHKELKIHRYVALRAFSQKFLTIPDKYKTVFDYRYTNFTGTLASFNIFKQDFYKTNFIYGFGVSEDVPEGFSLATTAGFVNQQNIGRPYAGIDAEYAHYNKKGFYSNYTFRLGGYFDKKRFEDVDMLFNIEHFSRLVKLNSTWFQRTFITTSITAQANPFLNAPLFLNSIYGLPYFQNGILTSDLRATVKTESVYYNTTKILGFRFAPFVFADISLIKPLKMNFSKGDGFCAFGGGVRTRNENLIFGTIELRGYYFPRTVGTMNQWKIDVSSNIRFKYSSTLISRPDFIIAN